MYHDEFAVKSARRASRFEDSMATLALEVGGGISLGAAMSLDQGGSVVLYLLGGLVPLVACSAEILIHQASEALGRLGLALRLSPIAVQAGPSPIVGLRGPKARLGRVGMARAGFDRAGRLG